MKIYNFLWQKLKTKLAARVVVVNYFSDIIGLIQDPRLVNGIAVLSR